MKVEGSISAINGLLSQLREIDSTKVKIPKIEGNLSGRRIIMFPADLTTNISKSGSEMIKKVGG